MNTSPEPDRAPKMETPEEHSGQADVSHGMNTNLSPDLATDTADAQAAQTVEHQHQQSDSDAEHEGSL
ncbi:hypothetical protein [Deinococcus sonorensis]|uniref:Uncharacterized protein n=2 Tax=Deinococcus sonorensis TaxID=309891 RepID=A0AAU7U9X9_9DEIO